MKFLRELYDSRFNYVKGCSSVMRYLNELILKGGVKRVSLLLAISIDFDHMFFFFFFHKDLLAELVLKRVEDIVKILSFENSVFSAMENGLLILGLKIQIQRKKTQKWLAILRHYLFSLLKLKVKILFSSLNYT